MGFKPTLFGFGDQCFIRLSYGRTYFYYIKNKITNQNCLFYLSSSILDFLKNIIKVFKKGMIYAELL